MYCSDEATIWMSSSAMKPPKHITTNGKRLRSQPAVAADIGLLPSLRRRPGIDTDCRRQAGAQLAEPRVAVIEGDANRHALHDLGEISGRVLRRDHAEDRSRAGR